MENHFYRFVRPQIFDAKRAEQKTNPKGGVCLRYEIQDDFLWFTHSRCSMSELFSKEVAKKMADTVADNVREAGWHTQGYCGRLPITKNTSKLFDETISWVLRWQIDTSASPSLFYLWHDNRDMILAMQNILTLNKQQEKIASDWQASMSAANFQQAYANG